MTKKRGFIIKAETKFCYYSTRHLPVALKDGIDQVAEEQDINNEQAHTLLLSLGWERYQKGR
jgi:hypothetical protein